MHVMKPVIGSFSDSPSQMHFFEDRLDASNLVPGGQFPL